jgi:hypothetical protein
LASVRVLPLIALLAACGPAQTVPTVVEPPPRDLGPEQLGPIPPEVRSVETDAYLVNVEGPTSAMVKQPVQARVVIKAKDGLAIVPNDFKIEATAAQDVDVQTPVVEPTPAPPTPTSRMDTLTYLVTVVPLRPGVRQITFKLGGQVCDESFCDVVGDLVSWNVEVR